MPANDTQCQPTTYAPGAESEHVPAPLPDATRVPENHHYSERLRLARERGREVGRRVRDGIRDHRDLYFLRNPKTGLVKVGVATDVARRKRDLENACGVRLEVHGVVPGGACHEQVIHRRFREERQVGEWFTPTPALLRLAGMDAGNLGRHVGTWEESRPARRRP